MKTTKGGKVMNPTDAYRKELRKKELRRNKKERKKVREVGILKKDPESIKEQIEKLEIMKADGALDKARKHKKRQLEDTLNLVLKKRKEYEKKMLEKGETPVMFSHLGPIRRRTNAEEDDRATLSRPEDSVYYHPTLNPTGAPPPGKPPMFKSSIGPRIPLAASSSAGASSSMSDSEEPVLTLPPPPPPPPLPDLDKQPSGDESGVPSSLPLPPPPPPPPNPAVSSGLMPPPPPGPPPKGAAIDNATLQPMHPPLPLQRPSQPPPPGTIVNQNTNNSASEVINMREPKFVLPLPPPPPGLPPKVLSDASTYVANAGNFLGNNETAKKIPLMPPPPPPLPQGVTFPNLQPDMTTHGMLRFPPPPPPPDMRPTLPVQGLLIMPHPPPPGMGTPPMLRPPFTSPPGPPPLMRPQGHPAPQDDSIAVLMRAAHQKPSYVKSAASTVVKRPLAQHTQGLTSMVPASVRVRRESALPKTKPKPVLSGALLPSRPVSTISTAIVAPKLQSIDDSYMAFLEDMKSLGALDG